MMPLLRIAIAMAILCNALPAAAQCFATPDNGTTVFNTADAGAVQQAVDAAIAGATVKVAGTCTGVQTVSGTTQTVRLEQPLTLEGGYVPALAGATWTALPDYVANPTVLSAGGAGRVVYASVVATLRGFTARDGVDPGNGGGIVAQSDLTLDTMVITANSAGGEGGGIFHASGTVAVVDSRITGNTAGGFGGGFLTLGTLIMLQSESSSNTSVVSGGGGLAVQPVTIFNSSFRNNTAGGGSAGLYSVGGGTISLARFIGNVANGGGGGGLYIQSGNALVENSLFSRNYSSNQGSAISSDSAGTVNVFNVTIRDGVPGPATPALLAANGTLNALNAIVTDAEIAVGQSGAAVVNENYNLFFNNGADYAGTVTSLGSSIAGDPLFVNAATDDLHVPAHSPAVNAGQPAFGAGTDLDGNPRVANGTIDIGAYEVAFFTVTPSAGANGAIAPATAQRIAPGGTFAFTVTPDPGFVASVGGTCGGSLAADTYTTDPVAADCTVDAAFDTGPAVTSVNVPANSTYVLGNNLDFTVNMTESATVDTTGGTPTIPITIGAIVRNATYIAGSGTSALTFRYTVQPGDVDGDGIAVGMAIVLNGGTIRDGASLDAALALNGVGITTGVMVAAPFTHTVTPSAGPNGSIAPSTPQAIVQGNSAAFTVTPNAGYTAVVGGTCGGTLAGNTYTTDPITGSCTVAATFTSIPTTTFTGPSATGTGPITASFTGGGPACTFTTTQFIPVEGHGASPPAGTAPVGVDFPHGLFDFTTSSCTPGSAITMTITYPAPLAGPVNYWKYGPTPTQPAPHWYILPATIAGNTATFSITDGGLGDDDLAANGTIVDQGGPGSGTGAIAVPTLSQWAMLLLASLMLLAGMRRARQP